MQAWGLQLDARKLTCKQPVPGVLIGAHWYCRSSMTVHFLEINWASAANDKGCLPRDVMLPPCPLYFFIFKRFNLKWVIPRKLCSYTGILIPTVVGRLLTLLGIRMLLSAKKTWYRFKSFNNNFFTNENTFLFFFHLKLRRTTVGVGKKPKRVHVTFSSLLQYHNLRMSERV